MHDLSKRAAGITLRLIIFAGRLRSVRCWPMSLNDQRESSPFYAKPVYRLVSGAFGVLLIGVGLYALILAGPLTVLSAAGGLLLVAVGGNTLASAFANKESWLSKIGPLP